jgi:hypothetical protein
MASGEKGSDLVAGSYIVGSATSVFSISELRLRFWPIVATIALGFLVILPSVLANSLSVRLMGQRVRFTRSSFGLVSLVSA